MNTSERLQAYHAFPVAITDRIEEIAEQQRSMDFRSFLVLQGIEDIAAYKTGNAVLDLIPKGDFDETRARVVHLPMANGLDSNQLYKVATLFAVDPTVRMIATANPSGPGYRSGVVGHSDRRLVAHGDYYPTVEPALRYINANRISLVDNIAGSYGVNKANAATIAASRYDHVVDKMVHVDPANLIDRRPSELGAAFHDSVKPLRGYTDAPAVPAYRAARDESVRGWRYNLGLIRLTNIAVTRGLTLGDYQEQTEAALDAQPGMSLHAVWGSESELCIDGVMSNIVDSLEYQYGDRMSHLRLPGQKHAMMGDLHLEAAVVYDALARR